MLTPKQIKRLRVELFQRYSLAGSGIHLGLKAGNGYEPKETRPYQPGDPARLINWQATAAQPDDTLMVRTRYEEHDLRATLVVDLYGGAHWGGGKAALRKTQVLQAAAETVIEVLFYQRDSFGLQVLAETIGAMRPGRDPRNRNRALELIRTANPGGASQLGATLTALGQRRRPKELIVVLSDFLIPGWEEGLRRLALRHEVLVIQVRDSWDSALPNVGPLPVLHEGKTVIVHTEDPVVRERYNAAAAAKQTKTEQVFCEAKGRHLLIDTGADWFDGFVQSLQHRPRRASTSERRQNAVA